MAPIVSSAAASSLPSTIEETSVEVNGRAIPLFFVSPKQINAQTPYGVSGTVRVRVRGGGGLEPRLDRRGGPKRATATY